MKKKHSKLLTCCNQFLIFLVSLPATQSKSNQFPQSSFSLINHRNNPFSKRVKDTRTVNVSIFIHMNFFSPITLTTLAAPSTRPNFDSKHRVKNFWNSVQFLKKKTFIAKWTKKVFIPYCHLITIRLVYVTFLGHPVYVRMYHPFLHPVPLIYLFALARASSMI